MFLDPVLKERPWSPSKVQTLLKCPLAFHLKYRMKLKEGPSGPDARIGTTAHSLYEWGLRDAMPDEASVLSEGAESEDDAPPTIVPVPSHTEEALIEKLEYLLDLFARAPRNKLNDEELAKATSYLPRVQSFILGMQRLAEKYGVEEFYLEHKASIDVDFKPTKYTDRAALIRGVMDMGFRTRDGMFVIIDHKTGKPKNLGDYDDQLRTYQIFVLAHYPGINAIQCGINHVRKTSVDWAEPVSIEDVEKTVKPWMLHYFTNVGVKLLQLEGRETTPKSSPLCNWCGYVDTPDLCMKGVEAILAKPLGPRLERQKKGLPVIQWVHDRAQAEAAAQ